MTKRENIENENSCWNKAECGEQVFVLLGRDKAMAATIRFWAEERIRLGLNKPEDPQIVSALEEAKQLEEQ